MTASVATFQEDWANHIAGKILRTLIAVGGVVTATMVVLLASLGTASVWILVLLGLALGVTAVRAAVSPTVPRLLMSLLAVIAIPLVGLVV